jgi:hypothetical protein
MNTYLKLLGLLTAAGAAASCGTAPVAKLSPATPAPTPAPLVALIGTTGNLSRPVEVTKSGDYLATYVIAPKYDGSGCTSIGFYFATATDIEAYPIFSGPVVALGPQAGLTALSGQTPFHLPAGNYNLVIVQYDGDAPGTCGWGVTVVAA